MDVVRTDVDGVPTFWSENGTNSDGERRGESDRDRGGYTVALNFRVGRADETLARSGITHLVEHLALHRIGQPEHNYNGEVSAAYTTFIAHGNADEVTAFLSTLCSALSDLPVDRLEAERRILHTEADGRGQSIAGRMALWRYGATGFGLPGYAELGLHALTAQDVRRWAAEWFTNGNAALGIIGGPPPEGLALKLPAGTRKPTPLPTNALPRTPARFDADINGVALNAVVGRSSAGQVYAALLRRRLHKALRQEGALSYTTEATYSPRDGHAAHILAFADGLASTHPRLAAEFVGEIERLAEVPVPAGELADAISIRRQEAEQAAGAMVSYACWNELMGAEQRTAAGLRRELDEVSTEQIQDVARAVLDSALLMLPAGTTLRTTRYTQAPDTSATAVEGTAFINPADRGYHLVSGPAGLTAMAGPSLATVRYDQCAAALAWPDGARVLIGMDGISVKVEPNRWLGGDQLTQQVDQSLPPELITPMPERPAEEIPSPITGVAAAPLPPARGSLEKVLDGAAAAYTRLARLRTDSAWSDPELAATLPKVRRGDLAAGLELLRASRDLPELRALRKGKLTQAVKGSSAALAAIAAKRRTDPDVHLWLGSVRIKEAWAVRGGALAKYVSQERFAHFWLLLAGAGEPLMRAAELLPHDPNPWDELQWHGLGLRMSRLELDRIWEELHRRGPAFFPGHYSRAQVLASKWLGSDEEQLAFGEATAASAPPGDPLTAILAAAHLEVASGSTDQMRRHFAGAGVSAALTQSANRWLDNAAEHPRAVEAHHLFGAAFYYAGETGKARWHLEAAGRTLPDGLPWGYHPIPAMHYRKVRKAVRRG